MDVEGNKGRNAVGVTGQGFDHINYLPTHLAVLALNTGEGTSTIIMTEDYCEHRKLIVLSRLHYMEM